jgi:hypothetical protein
VVRVSAVIDAIDAVAKSAATSVYVEILSKHGVRMPAPIKPADADASEETPDNTAD